MGRFRSIVSLAVLAAVVVPLAVVAAFVATAPIAGGKPRKKKAKQPAITTDEKLEELIRMRMTSAEIAIATGCSVRAIEERRKRLSGTGRSQSAGQLSKVDTGIDQLYSLASLLEEQHLIPAENVRAWFIGRSAYLQEQRPASMLAAGQFELAREAAIAYATGETPNEFIERVGMIIRVSDLLEV